jgi:hypothetical protein
MSTEYHWRHSHSGMTCKVNRCGTVLYSEALYWSHMNDLHHDFMESFLLPTILTQLHDKLSMLSQRWNCFLVCSASDENMFRVCSASHEICSAYAQHILNVNIEMGYDFPLGWACSKIVYSLAEHARKICYMLAEHAWKLVIRLLSMRENWLLASLAYAKIILTLRVHFLPFFSLHPVTILYPKVGQS